MKNELSQSEYWKQRCLLVEQCLAESPCDPDITSEQIEAHKKLREFLSNYKIKQSTNCKHL
ncbi:MAG: hypothetical protein KDD03_13120 [Gelidibacter sp.]|nr:hypothetical protein [Gelidibacter sp.]